MLEKYGLADCHPIASPMNPGLVLTADMCPSSPEELASMRSVPYLSALGSLQYLATMTCPDIQFAVNYLARFNSNPGKQHWLAVKHLFRYLKGTLDYKLTYAGPLQPGIFSTYCDASHGDCKDSGRSTGGYVAIMGGGALCWKSKLHRLVTLSTCEAEFIEAVEAAKEMMWLRNLLGELGYPMTGPSTLYIDNAGAVSVSKNPEHHGRMKHLDLRFFWLRDAVESGVIHTANIPGTQQPADILTKPLPIPKVDFCRTSMGLGV